MDGYESDTLVQAKVALKRTCIHQSLGYLPFQLAILFD